MSLANMRQNGVRFVIATCACGHKADVLVDALPETAFVPEVGRRLKCSACGGKTIDTRPAWHTRRATIGGASGLHPKTRTSPHWDLVVLATTAYNALMKEFEKLAALLGVYERAPLIDRAEAAKLAARWGRPGQRPRAQPVGAWMQPRDRQRPGE